MTTKDDLGTRMKLLEGLDSKQLIPLLPVMIRLDCRSFSKFCSGLMRPYDFRVGDLMIATAKELVKESNAKIAYIESDEISLVLYSDSYDSQVFFDGKIQKLVSVLASIATAKFNSLVSANIPERHKQLVHFDCRVWNVPNKTEAANVFVWRSLDCLKNSVSMLARHYFSAKELHGKGRADQLQMLESVGIYWPSYPNHFKNGSWVRRETYETELKEEDLPEDLGLESKVGQKVTRSRIVELEVPPFTKVLNKVEFIFDKAKPIHLISMPDWSKI